MNLKSHRWQKSAIALAAVTLFGLSAPASWALSLGSIVVQSALGEPLRAEIDVPDINAEEAASLKATIASPEAFKAAGLEFNSALSGLRVSLQRRANGRAFIRLTSDKPVSEPFVDMILEASWASGRIVRDYTMLFDPPSLKAAPIVPTPAAVSAVQIAQSQPATLPAAIGTTAAGTRPSGSAQRPMAKPAIAAERAPVSSDKQITVKAGDTAGRIAMAVKPATISLDQMLVALLRSNPNAFINGNINRIKSGAVMNVPSAEEAQSMGTAEATQTVIAQSRDFGDFRKKLASNAPTASMAAPDRKASGSVQTKVDDKKVSAAAPDKLTLSKGAIKAQAETERVAKERAAKESAGREAEVKKNMTDLAKLGASSPKPAASTSSTVPTAATVAANTATSATAAITSAAPIVAATTAPAVATSAPAMAKVAPPASAPATATVAAAKPTSAADAPKPKAKPVAPPVEVAEPSLIDQLTDNPLIPAAGIGLVALLAGFGFYRSRQRKQAEQEDSAFLESRLQPDSFFGASGGQKVDTNDGVGGSSMVYTPSQLDAADDVDPVAEADVYLAYGRDVQAEEILREALKFNPARVAIHHKLLEILAKRRDVAGFATAAGEAHKATGGDGADWLRVCDMGLSLDPQNTLYMPGGRPSNYVSAPAPLEPGSSFGAVGAAGAFAAAGVAAGAMAASGSAASSAAASSFAAITTPLALQATDTGPVDLSFDLDLDFSLDEENANVIKDMGNAERTSRMAPLNSGPVPLDMNFELPAPVSAPAPLSAALSSPSAAAASAVPAQTGSIEFTMPSMATPTLASMSVGEAEEFRQQAAVSFGNTIAGPLATFAPKVAEPVADTAGMMEFDLGSLSMDLNETTVATMATAAVAPTAQDDPLATKLSLAEEFSTIGDEDGARALIEEVIAEATGDMRTKAQAALAKLN